MGKCFEGSPACEFSVQCSCVQCSRVHSADFGNLCRISVGAVCCTNWINISIFSINIDSGSIWHARNQQGPLQQDEWITLKQWRTKPSNLLSEDVQADYRSMPLNRSICNYMSVYIYDCIIIVSLWILIYIYISISAYSNSRSVEGEVVDLALPVNVVEGEKLSAEKCTAGFHVWLPRIQKSLLWLNRINAFFKSTQNAIWFPRDMFGTKERKCREVAHGSARFCWHGWHVWNEDDGCDISCRYEVTPESKRIFNASVLFPVFLKPDRTANRINDWLTHKSHSCFSIGICEERAQGPQNLSYCHVSTGTFQWHNYCSALGPTHFGSAKWPHSLKSKRIHIYLSIYIYIYILFFCWDCCSRFKHWPVKTCGNAKCQSHLQTSSHKLLLWNLLWSFLQWWPPLAGDGSIGSRWRGGCVRDRFRHDISLTWPQCFLFKKVKSKGQSSLFLFEFEGDFVCCCDTIRLAQNFNRGRFSQVLKLNTWNFTMSNNFSKL